MLQRNGWVTIVPRADLLVNLIKAAQSSDMAQLHRIVEAIAAEERAKNHHTLANRIISSLNNERSKSSLLMRPGEISSIPFLHEKAPSIGFDDLILTEDVRTAIDELVEEQHRSALLRSYSVEPRHRILLSGPPGNGKTSLAEAVANALMVPFLVVSYDSLIGSLLGESAERLARVFAHIRSRECVIFFDEFETLAKERGDGQETGEIRRLVSSLLLHIDALPSYCVIVTATNHPEMLDRAAWRRFELRLELGPPKKPDIERWLCKFEERTGMPLGVRPKQLSSQLVGCSYSDLEQIGLDLYRQFILRQPDADMRELVGARVNKTMESLVLK